VGPGTERHSMKILGCNAFFLNEFVETETYM
jgi:hypothetical protein